MRGRRTRWEPPLTQPQLTHAGAAGRRKLTPPTATRHTGRPKVIAVERGVALASFCMTIDWVVAAIIVIEIAAGLHFR